MGTPAYVNDFASVFPLTNEAERTDLAPAKAVNTGTIRAAASGGSLSRECSKSFPQTPTLLAGNADFGSPIRGQDTPSLTRRAHPCNLPQPDFWTTSAFGESTKFIPVTDPRITGVTGVFVRTLKAGSRHLAAGIFADASPAGFGCCAVVAESGGDTIIRYKHLTNTDISLLYEYFWYYGFS